VVEPQAEAAGDVNRPTMEAVHDAVAAIPKIDRRSGMLSSPLP